MKRNTVESQSLHDVRRKVCAAVEAAMQNQFLLKTTPRNQFNIMKKNAKPILGGYACVRFPFFRILTLAFLLAATSLAWAQDGYPDYDPDWVATLTEWDGEGSGDFKISSDKDISRTVQVAANKELRLFPVKNPTTGINPTITKKVKGDASAIGGRMLFEVKGKLYIIGNDSNKLNIYGNSGNPNSPIPTQTNYQGTAITTEGDSSPGIWLKYVDFYGFITHTDIGSGNNTRQGGTVTMDYSSGGKCNMDHVTFRNNYGGPIDTKSQKGYGRIISLVNGVWDVKLDYVTIHDCIISEYLGGYHYEQVKLEGMGSVIRSQGQVGGSLTMTNCTAYNNTYRDLSASANHSILDYTTMEQINAQPLSGQGGVVNWRSGRKAPDGSTQVTIKNCNFHHNSARCGGAIATCATIDLVNTNIHHNEAELGGGVYFYTYRGQDNPYDGRGFDATFGEGVNVYENEAKYYGGGIFIGIDASDDVGFEAYDAPPQIANGPKDAYFKVEIQTGSEIHGNKAPKGAGIAIRDSAPYKHYNCKKKLIAGAGDNLAFHTWSGEYHREVIVNGGHVYGNTTDETTGDEMTGAGILVEKYPTTFQFIYDDGGPSPVSYSQDYYDYSDAGGGSTVYGAGRATVNAESGKIFDNTAINDAIDGFGGGMYIASKFDDNIRSILDVNIGKSGEVLEMYNNQAYTDGGGVYVLYNRDNVDQLNEGTVTVADGSIGFYEYIDNNNNNNIVKVSSPNKALTRNGGGICVLGGTVFVNGGNILYNIAAELGGGVYVSVPNNNSKTTIQGGANISENTAKGGGGVYVDKGELDVFGNRWNNATEEWEMLDWTGYTTPGAETAHTRITNNTATDGNGGGINAGNGEVDIFNTLIYYNTADGTVSKGRGGGVYLDGGFIKIYNSKILNNTAETNGGGIDDHSGDIEIYGGDISHNTATNGRGGGIYTNAGDIRIWPSALYNNPAPAPSLEQCENTGTVFSYNTAGTNGGGLNTHIGRLDVRFANVHHNEAGTTYGSNGQGSDGQGATGSGGSGGGMFCEGPHADLSGYTVRLLHTDLNDNKAYGSGGSGNDLTGRGGGLYLKYGSIFAEHCNILRNEADINGGGLDNHDGELRVYGSFVDHNKAKKGRGGGLYTDKGNLVVGPCDSYGFVNSKASRICNNTAYINGGGINNHEGDITIHGDRINNNTAQTGKGGGVYINSGNIYMYGGQINNNHADDPSGGYGGGVYGGGGTFNIMEREAHPILEILEVEKITTSGFTVHFHHVDRGFAMESGATEKEYGIAYSENPYPSNLGENVDWTGHWDNVTTIGFAPSAEQPTPPAPHSYNQYEGCSRFDASGLTSGKTYYVVAYGKYRKGDKNYFDVSPAVKVKTHGDLPVVVTGVGFDITRTSASVNGKLFYGGSSDVTEKGIEIYNGSNWTAQASSSVGDVFSVTFNDLTPNTEYKARAYAKNNGGNSIGYGDEITFTTVASGKAMEDVGNTPRSIYPSVEENPFFRELTPLQQAIMASTFEGDSTVVRHQKSRDDDGPIDIPQINNNTATYGGGICIDKEGARLIFSGIRGEIGEDGIGQINYNYASEAGGGIYIGKESADEYAKMQMMGKCEVNNNHVPAGKHGGGIYLDGRLYVGDKDTDPIGTHGLKVDNNWAVDGAGAGLPDGYAASGKLNNVFLTRYDYEYNANATEAGDNKVSVITLLSDISGYADAMNTNPHSHIGFSVLKGFCPVIATSDCFSKIVNEEEVDGNYNLHNYTPTGESESVSTETWLRNLMIMSGVAGGTGTADALTGAVFEDSESYVAVHTQSDIAPFRCKFIYLWGCWTHPVVKYDPETNNPMRGLSSTNTEDGWLHHYIIRNPTDNVDITGESPNTTPLEWEIYSPEGLAWFSAYVNGLNAFDEVTGATDDDNNHHAWKENKNPYAIAHIMNDLDMSAYLWVPIGSVKYFFINSIGNDQGGSLFVDAEKELTIEGHTYNDNHKFKGTFDGHGHVINGLQGLYLTGIKKYGLFGYLDDGAVVKNTFVDEGFFVSDDKDVVYSAGGIAGKMNGGTLSNSEARMDFNVGYSGSGTAVGGLVGEVETTDSEETILIHSSMAMPFITGHDKGEGGETPTFNAFEGYMGGLVGRLGSGCDLKNSFSNVEIVLTSGGSGPTATRHIGGLVGENNGTVENCYTRYQGTNTPDGFGWSAGTNNGTVTFCYIPNGKSPYVANGTPQNNNCTTYGTTQLFSGKYGFRHRDQQMTANNNNGNIINDVFLGGLLPTLNKWVETANTELPEQKYSTWTRTMASPINDDYPILVFKDFNSVGSKDKIYMLYEDDINHMWNASVMEGSVVTIPGKDFQALNTPESVAAMYMYDVQPSVNVSSDPESPEYKPVDVTISENINVPLYIHEDVGITQKKEAALTARAGVTIVEGANWHLFSPAISGVPMGIEYHGTVDYQNSVDHNTWSNRNLFDPPMTSWTTSDAFFNYSSTGFNNVGYFPTNTPYGTWRPGTTGGQNATDANVGGFFDLYDYSEVYYHWINYKRQSDDHWHWDKSAKDGKHYEIDGYINDIVMPAGKAYLMALSSESMMMADGLLNNTDYTVDLTNTPVGTNLPPGGHGSYPYDEPWRGINLIGNPYQSYLDFNRLSTTGKGEVPSVYAVIDESNPESSRRYVYYFKSQSRNDPYSATGLLHPHQGFFVKVDTPTTVSFTKTMRVAGNESLNVPFRNEVNYPLVNLLCYDEDGNRDLTTIELNRPEFGGGHKMEKLHESKGLIYAHLENESFQTLFAPVGINVVPVRFVPVEDGNFTLNWNTRHGEFSYLHLIDNITGVDVDCLTTDEYKFEGKTSDYKSRFKLVFRCEGDEPEDPEDPEEPDNPDDGEDSDHFAFMFGDEMVVNGEGMLQMFDVQGRCLMETRAVGQQSSHTLPSVAAGVYVFRLTGDKRVKVQKMVIK